MKATKAEMELRRTAIFRIVADMRPMTVRQVFYQATVHGLIAKTEKGYHQVQRLLSEMRRSGKMPFDWIVDNTRYQRRPLTYRSVQEALDDVAAFYRKSLWDEADCHIQVWIEKDALAGVIEPVTSKYDVPLMVARGYSSITFLHEAATEIKRRELPTFIYHCGDFDPSGVDAAYSVEDTLREFAPEAEIHFQRVAVTEGQIRRWRLPTRPTKLSDSRAQNFGDISVELDAIEPGRLRTLVEEAILRHLPPARYKALMVREQRERKLLASLVKRRNG